MGQKDNLSTLGFLESLSFRRPHLFIVLFKYKQKSVCVAEAFTATLSGNKFLSDKRGYVVESARYTDTAVTTNDYVEHYKTYVDLPRRPARLCQSHDHVVMNTRREGNKGIKYFRGRRNACARSLLVCSSSSCLAWSCC